MNEQVLIKRLFKITEEEINSLVDLSTAEGHNHVKRLKEDYFAGINKFEGTGEVLYGAFQGSELIGICGLNQDSHSDKGLIGRVRRLYIKPNYRRKGIARQLMITIIQEARKSFKTLILRTDNPDADIFYRTIGFEADDHGHYTHIMHLEEVNV